MQTERLKCPNCRHGGLMSWPEDRKGTVEINLPYGFHPEVRPGLGPVIVCDACGEIIQFPR